MGAWRRLSGKQADRLVDIDGLSEAVDVMRGCGLTDGGDPLLCSATLAILELQKTNGSWPAWRLARGEGQAQQLVTEPPAKPTMYDLLHPTWVAVQSLRDRCFEYSRKGNQQWEQYMAKLLKETMIGKLEYKVKYVKQGRRKESIAVPPAASIPEVAFQDDGDDEVVVA